MSESTAELLPATDSTDLDAMARAESPAIWTDFRDSFEKLRQSADAVLAADPALASSSKLARAARLELRAVRLAVENKRKELGEYHLRKTQAINSAAGQIKALIEPYEEKLLEVEKHADRVEAERIQRLTAERVAEISAFTTISGAIDYGRLSEEDYARLLADAKAAHEARQAEARRIEEDRLARERAEAEERERIRVENERLRKEAEAREAELRAERERAEAERRALEEKARAERAVAEEKARIEREKVEAERKAAEELAARERAERERLEAEARQREEKAAADRRAAERAAKKAAAAPDREKLKAYAQALGAVPKPTLKNVALLSRITTKVDALVAHIEVIDPAEEE
jgi:hypothetical protein